MSDGESKKSDIQSLKNGLLAFKEAEGVSGIKQMRQAEEEKLPIQNTSAKLHMSIPEEELRRINLEKGLFARLMVIGGEKYVDLRRFYKNFPTKKGVRIPLSVFKAVAEVLTSTK